MYNPLFTIEDGARAEATRSISLTGLVVFLNGGVKAR